MNPWTLLRTQSSKSDHWGLDSGKMMMVSLLMAESTLSSALFLQDSIYSEVGYTAFLVYTLSEGTSP